MFTQIIKFLIRNNIIRKKDQEDILSNLINQANSWNGYNREDAIKQLKRLKSPLALPVLIERANDWVPEVRVAAKKALLALITDNNVDAFIKTLPTLYQLKNCHRDNHEDLIQSVEQLLNKEKHATKIQEALHATADNKQIQDQYAVPRACMKLCIINPAIDSFELTFQGLHHPDLVVRQLSNQLIGSFKGTQLTKLLIIAIKDQSTPIRRSALRLMVKQGVSVDFVVTFLFDKSQSVREVAVYHLKRHNYDVSGTYQSELKSTSVIKVRSAIWGLAYLNDVKSADQIIDFLDSPLVKTRKLAIAALTKLNPDLIMARKNTLLQDQSLAVCKVVIRSLNKLPVSFTADELISLVNTSKTAHIHTVCFCVAHHINKWEQLIFLLSLIGCDNKSMDCQNHDLDSEIQHWSLSFNKNFIQVNDKQKSQIDVLYTKIKNTLSPYNQNDYDYLFKYHL